MRGYQHHGPMLAIRSVSQTRPDIFLGQFRVVLNLKNLLMVHARRKPP